MRNLKKLLGAFLCLCLCYSLGLAQKKTSEPLISLQAKQKNLDLVLKEIGRQSKKTFSYTPSAIDVKQKITVSIRKKSLKEALDLIFEDKITYKIRGKYIILSPQTSSKKEPKQIIIRGYVKDKETQQSIAYASIYESGQLEASLSNQNGYFELKLNATASAQQLKISINKRQYWSEELTLAGNQNHFLKVTLLAQSIDSVSAIGGTLIPEQLPQDSLKIESVEVSVSKKTEIKQAIRKNFAKIASPVADFFLSMKQKAHLNNLDSSFYDVVQLSILPSLSTNPFLGGNTVHDFSFNIIGGYNQGVNVLEIGGLFNIIREEARYFQVAGLSNTVGGKMDGLQVAGLLNKVRGKTSGLQVSGLLNITQNTLSGVQIAGILNSNSKAVKGAQIAGLINLSKRQMYSLQVGGLLNHTQQAVGGFQLGLINMADSAQGLIPIGFLSFVKKGDQYKRLEISVDELLNTTLSFKTGVPRFYNILTLGVAAEAIRKPSYLLGYGLGTSLMHQPSWSIDLTVNALQVIREKEDWLKHVLLKGGLSIEKKLSKKISLAAGASLNYWYGTAGYGLEQYYAQKPPMIMSENLQETLWVGYQGALRYVF